MKALILSTLLAGPLLCSAQARDVGPAVMLTQAAASSGTAFDTTVDERTSIEEVLTTYTDAVSSKNQSKFESILLSKNIPFSYVPAGAAGAGLVDTANYEKFRRSVFEGAPFTQRFTDAHILVDGNLASVTLVFTNSHASGASSGWKTMHLLKTPQGWKIASEFYTSQR